jgi:hypothetical protein
VVANGASMQKVEGSIPTAPRSPYNGSCSDYGLKGNLVKLYIFPYLNKATAISRNSMLCVHS